MWLCVWLWEVLNIQNVHIMIIKLSNKCVIHIVAMEHKYLSRNLFLFIFSHIVNRTATLLYEIPSYDNNIPFWTTSKSIRIVMTLLLFESRNHVILTVTVRAKDVNKALCYKWIHKINDCDRASVKYISAHQLASKSVIHIVAIYYQSHFQINNQAMFCSSIIRAYFLSVKWQQLYDYNA